jgi:hypothetical protein
MAELDKIHEEGLKEFNDIQTSNVDGREQSLEDRRFASITGAQWEGKLGETFDGKPKPEVNKVQLALQRIFNEYRNNRITVDFISKEGGEYDKLADTCDGLYRADEQDSVAEEAYDNAFDEGTTGGMGAWRLRAAYEDEEDEEDERQRIIIEPIFDADSSVFFDLNAKRQDKADAKSCYVITAMTIASYIDTYDDDPASWPKEVGQTEFDWYTPDVVYVAEYYKVEEEYININVWVGMEGEEERYSDDDFKEDKRLKAELKSRGFKKDRTKKVKRNKVHKYIMSGSGILEDCGYIAGSCIPIVPMYGKRWFIDNIERFMGHVRLAKDTQRVKNSLTSQLWELSALSPIEKPIFVAEQVARHRTMWEDGNVTDYPYFLVDQITNADGSKMPAGPVGFTKVPQIPPALAALLQVTEQDLQDLLGNQQAGEQLQPNMSGKAVELIQNRLDMQVFIYMSNMAKAMKRSGEIWLGMARDLYVEKGRKMKAVSASGAASSIVLGEAQIDVETGEVEDANDLSKAKFDIVSSVGPSSDSKRASTVRALTGMLSITQDPETISVLNSLIMMNMEGEGTDEAAEFFRKKLVNMGVVQPTEEEAKEMAEAQANAQPDANTQYLNAAANEANANAKESDAKTIETMANAEKKRAETQEILAGIDIAKLENIVKLVSQLQPPQEQVTVPGVVQGTTEAPTPLSE